MPTIIFTDSLLIANIGLYSIIFQHIRSLSHVRFALGSPNGSFSSFALLWMVRVVTFGLLLRTYFIPWLFTLLSDRIRIRSISLRSIRGLRFRKGAQTWKVERISYNWLSVEGSRRLALRIEGLTVEFGSKDVKTERPIQKNRDRKLTLADFNPSPIARQLWQVVWATTTFIEPYFRPILRKCLISCLRFAIQWLPKLTQALSFDLQSTVITFPELSGAKISAENINLHSVLTFTEITQAIALEDAQLNSSREGGMVEGFSLWKKRLAESFHRSLDAALGESHGTAKMSLRVSNVVGSMRRSPQGDSTFNT